MRDVDNNDYNSGYANGSNDTATEITDNLIKHIKYHIGVHEDKIKHSNACIQQLKEMEHAVNKHRP